MDRTGLVVAVFDTEAGTTAEVLATGGRRLRVDLDGRQNVRPGDRLAWGDRTDRAEWDRDGVRMNVRRLGPPYPVDNGGRAA